MTKQAPDHRLKRSSTQTDDMIDNLGIVKRDFLGGNRPNSVLTQEGLTIVLINGSITDQKTDAIVNSVGGKFNLNQGALSKTILEKAGPKIQEKLTSLRPVAPRCGDVITTEGFNLSASFVFHGVLKQWGQGKDDAEKVLRSFIRNCLTEAHKRSLKSISFPAVGTGVLGFPSDLVSECLFDEADKFSSSNPNTTINEIRFAIYEQDKKTLNAFETKLKEIMPIVNDEEEQSSAKEEYINVFDDPGESSSDEELSSSARLRGLNKAAIKASVKFGKIGIGIPSTWKPLPSGSKFGTTLLDSSDDEFKMVAKKIFETKGNAAITSIQKIERIENRMLYQLYTVYKQDMEERNGTGVENERILWHGTVKESLDNICSGGFNRSYCGKNAVAFGKGVYFARNFEYSAQNLYSRPDENGTKYVFRCRVLTGTFTVGNPSMIEPEQKPGASFRHDSTVNNIDDPAIFVVFRDAMAYPEYLVAFN